MPTKSTNARKSHDWEETYDLPKELDLRKLRVVGVGLESLRKHASAKIRVVELEPDVAKEFPTAKAVNEALRQFHEIRRVLEAGVRKKRTA
jgi:hypothetical protein